MGFLKDLDKTDAALFITLFALTLIAGITAMSVFTNIEANAIVMIVLGKLMVLLDAAIFFFFQGKKEAKEAVEAATVLLDYPPEAPEPVQATLPTKAGKKPPYNLNPL